MLSAAAAEKRRSIARGKALNAKRKELSRASSRRRTRRLHEDGGRDEEQHSAAVAVPGAGAVAAHECEVCKEAVRQEQAWQRQLVLRGSWENVLLLLPTSYLIDEEAGLRPRHQAHV